jgi:CHAD domain-containing protein
MATDHTKRIEKLQKKLVPVEPQDSMAEAGRKVLLADFIKMLENEAGSRTGEDIENVHMMRVSTRRMRSAFRLLDDYFKTKAVKPYLVRLRAVAQALGTVRDLDVIIFDLIRFLDMLDENRKASLQGVIDRLNQHRDSARKDLIKLLDSKTYRTFVKDYGLFLTTPGLGVVKYDVKLVTPYQVRHLLPTLIYEHMGAVRAYETMLDQADDVLLHALRIEFKRLRYVVTLFAEVLGASINGFISELKLIQDHLGRLHDISITMDWLDKLISDSIDDTQKAVLQEYVEMLEGEKPQLIAAFPEVWEHFNTRTVQRKLSDSLLVLR